MTNREKTRRCPACQTLSGAVKPVTLRHHLRFPLSASITSEPHFFCSNKACHWAYFSDSQHYKQTDLQSYHAIQSGMLCYCFGITEATFIDQVKKDAQGFFNTLDELAHVSTCYCKIKNPAGRGCLRTFKSLLNTLP